MSPYFISKSTTFLYQSRLEDLPQINVKPPMGSCAIPMLDPAMFRNYIRENFLGHTSLGDGTSAPSFLHPMSGSISSLYSVGGSPHATDFSTRSDISRMSFVESASSVYSSVPAMLSAISAELLCYTDTRRFQGSHLTKFSGAMMNDE